MATRTDEDVVKVLMTVVDEDTVRFGASEFKRVHGSRQAPWAEAVRSAKAIRAAKAKVDE